MFRVVLAALLLLAPSVAVADITGKPRVIDGDTIEIAGARFGNTLASQADPGRCADTFSAFVGALRRN